MKKLFLIFTLNLLCLFSFAQLPPKIEDNKLFGKGCYYFKQMPDNNQIKGVLVLVPGYGEHPYSVSAQTTILQQAAKNGVAVVIVNLTPNNEDLPIDENAINKLGNMIKHFYKQENLTASIKLFLGGFSIGGTTALKFYHQKNSEFKIYKIFAIDPPLDMVRLRKSLAKGTEKNVIAKLDAINPDKKLPQNGLKKLSVYNPDFTTLAMLPNYLNTSLRIYSEPDILWWIKNRKMDLSDMNVTDGAAYINSLLKKDPSQKVELILTKNMGIRNGNQQHPHSWSIAEPVDLINWLLKD